VSSHHRWITSNHIIVAHSIHKLKPEHQKPSRTLSTCLRRGGIGLILRLLQFSVTSIDSRHTISTVQAISVLICPICSICPQNSSSTIETSGTKTTQDRSYCNHHKNNIQYTQHPSCCCIHRRLFQIKL
jgi:hypothetical protein